jgi:hypothetical protein
MALSTSTTCWRRSLVGGRVRNSEPFTFCARRWSLVFHFSKSFSLVSSRHGGFKSRSGGSMRTNVRARSNYGGVFHVHRRWPVFPGNLDRGFTAELAETAEDSHGSKGLEGSSNAAWKCSSCFRFRARREFGGECFLVGEFVRVPCTRPEARLCARAQRFAPKSCLAGWNRRKIFRIFSQTRGHFVRTSSTWVSSWAECTPLAPAGGKPLVRLARGRRPLGDPPQRNRR